MLQLSLALALWAVFREPKGFLLPGNSGWELPCAELFMSGMGWFAGRIWQAEFGTARSRLSRRNRFSLPAAIFTEF